jgi:hypothetical protein
MPETGSAESGGADPATPPQPSNDVMPKKADSVEQHDFANPTLNIINSLSRRASTSALSAPPSREGTPPPLPPRPRPGFLHARPSTSHSIHSIRKAPSRPQLVSKATTQLSLSNGQAFGSESRDDSASSNGTKQRSFLGANLHSHSASDADDGASVRSFVPAGDGAAGAESILGEVMDRDEKTETEKKLMRSLGHNFVESEAQSMFPPDAEFDVAFHREFDDIESLSADGSNEGLASALHLDVACADVVNRDCYAPMACQTEAFFDLVQCR